MTNLKEELLGKAADATYARNGSYGPPDQDFYRTASILNALGYRMHANGLETPRLLEPVDVARFGIALKLSRSMHSPDHADNWVDVAGYSACAYEIMFQ